MREYMDAKTACVVIGRNEGLRLVNCLNSVNKKFTHVIYVDSGSSDNSRETAKNLDAIVLDLDMTIPFTAARARNEGLNYLLDNYTDIEYVQFIDGDCELVEGWYEEALKEITKNEEIAAVCGRRKEKYPDRTKYNRLCDIEWNTPIGFSDACGGDVLFRASALKEINGYNATLIAGEEPELCLRLRQKGWKILRIAQEMTLHDADIHTLSQWWKRTARGGYAYMSVYWMHRRDKINIWKKEILRSLLWALVIPLVIIFLSLLLSPAYLILFSVYFLLKLKIVFKSENITYRYRPLYANYMILSKFAELNGVLKAAFDIVTKRKSKIMEYK